MEYFIKVWGGAWNDDACPSIEHDLGIKEGCYYFPTESERQTFIDTIHQPKYKSQGMMYTTREGENLTHKKTIFVGVFEYMGQKFTIHKDFDYEYPEEDAIFMFKDGNYSCDCNRSLFIRREYGEDVIPDLGCGDDIKLIEYHIEYID